MGRYPNFLHLRRQLALYWDRLGSALGKRNQRLKSIGTESAHCTKNDRALIVLLLLLHDITIFFLEQR